MAALQSSPTCCWQLQRRESARNAHVTGMPPPTCSTTSSALPLGSDPFITLAVPSSSSSSSRSSTAGSRGSLPSLISSSMLRSTSQQIDHRSPVVLQRLDVFDAVASRPLETIAHGDRVRLAVSRMVTVSDWLCRQGWQRTARDAQTTACRQARSTAVASFGSAISRDLCGVRHRLERIAIAHLGKHAAVCRGLAQQMQSLARHVVCPHHAATRRTFPSLLCPSRASSRRRSGQCLHDGRQQHITTLMQREIEGT